MELKLTQIRLDGGTQARDKMDKNTISEYAQQMMEGAVFPPIEVFYDKKDYWLVDGFHRYHACMNIKRKEIEVKVFEGTKHEAFEYSLGVNDKHGRPRSSEDKRKALNKAFNDPITSKNTTLYISKKCKVTPAFVIKYKLQLEKEKLSSSKPDAPKVETVTEDEHLIPSEHYELAEEDKLKELSSSNVELIEEVEKLKFDLAVLKMEEDTAAQEEIKETIATLRDENKRLERELDAMKVSRDQYMKKANEAVKQVTTLQKKLKALEK
jgi:hypothetical protein